jgi:hypothetical protein
MSAAGELKRDSELEEATLVHDPIKIGIFLWIYGKEFTNKH